MLLSIVVGTIGIHKLNIGISDSKESKVVVNYYVVLYKTLTPC